MNRKEGETHFYMAMPAYYVSGMFQEMWRNMFGKEPGIDPDYNRLMSGFESSDVVFTRALWKLGREAVDLGLEDLFKKTDDADVLAAIECERGGQEVV